MKCWITFLVVVAAVLHTPWGRSWEDSNFVSAGALGSSQQSFDLSVSSTRLVADALVILEPGSICSYRSIDLSLARAYGLLSAAPFPYSGSPVVQANRIVTGLHVLLLLL